MGFHLIQEVSNHYCGSPTAKSVLLCLAKFADDDDQKRTAWPSEQTIEKYTEFSRRAVIQALQNLEALGFIRIRKRKTNSYLRNVYYITLSEKWPDAEISDRYYAKLREEEKRKRESNNGLQE